MTRYVSWLLNGALFVFCCFLVADTANAIFAVLLAPAAEEVADAPDSAPSARRSWDDRQVILARNLFNASLIAPAGGPPEPEELEAAKIPMDLLGTVASDDQDLAWAAVQNRQDRTTQVVRIDDLLAPQVKVLRIERRRVVLLEGDTPRELVLSEPVLSMNMDPKDVGRLKRTSGTRPHASGRARRARERRAAAAARPKPEPASAPVAPQASAVRDLTDLLSGASYQPKYEDGQMVGVVVNAVQGGSLFEEIGIADGDVITEVNGISIDSPQESTRVLLELIETPDLEVKVLGPEGPRTLTHSKPGG
jgi:general secretion pathway protein C